MNADFPLNFEKTKENVIEGLLSRSFEIETSDDSTPEVYFTPAMEGFGEAHPLFEEEDRDILLHREAHFASSFALMLAAYEDETHAAVLDVSTDQIRRLHHLEEKLGKNLAPMVLHAQDAVMIAKIRKLYSILRETLSEPKSPEMALIADLILSEEDPEETATRIANTNRTSATSSLIALIEHDLFYDPLWPGYGHAPSIAALVLGKWRAHDAIRALFSMLQHDSFDVQSAALTALRQIGEPAKKFCLKMLATRPICKDNEHAALALCSFAPDVEVFTAIQRELGDPTVQKHTSFVQYLQAYEPE